MDQMKEIRTALPKKLDATSYDKVQRSLQTALTAVPNTLDDDKCFAVLKTGIMCLIKIMRLWASSYPVENGDSILNLILEFLMVASDQGIKSSSYVASFITSICLEIVLSNKFAVLIKIEVLNKLNFIFESTDPSLKKKLLQTEFLQSNRSKLFQLVFDVGDYEFQVCLMEFFCRLIPQKLRQEYCTAMIEDPEIRQAYFAVRDCYFEVDCRKFLNYVNSNQDKDNRKVFSYPCDSITFGTVPLQKPCDLGYNEFWWDINMGSKRIIIFCESTQPSSQMSFDDGWDNVSIWQADIAKFTCQEEQDQLHVKLFIKPTAQCIPHGCNDPFPILHVVTSQQYDLKTILCQFLGKLGNIEEKRDESLSVTQKSKTHSSGTPLMDKWNKISVPSEPMSTPASSIVLESIFSHATGNTANPRKASNVCSPQAIQPNERYDSSPSATQRSERLERRRSASLSCPRASKVKTGSLSERDVSMVESHRSLRSSQRQTQKSPSSGEADNLLSQGRSRQSEKKDVKSSSRSGDKSKVKNFRDGFKLKERTDQTAPGCARYAFRDCTNKLSKSRERTQLLIETETKNKRQTVSAKNVGSESLEHETMKSLKEKKDQKVKKMKDSKSKISEQKAKPAKDSVNSQIPQTRNRVRKCTNEGGLKKDFVSDSKRVSNDSQVIDFATDKKKFDQQLKKRETRSELKSASPQRAKHLVEKQIYVVTEDEASRLKPDAGSQQKSNNRNSRRHTSPGLKSLQNSADSKQEKSLHVLVSQSSSDLKQSHSGKLCVTDKGSKIRLPADDYDEDDPNWRVEIGAEDNDTQDRSYQERSKYSDLQDRHCQDRSDQNHVQWRRYKETTKSNDQQERNHQERSEQTDRQRRSYGERSQQTEGQERNQKRSEQNSKQRSYRERSEQNHQERSEQTDRQRRSHGERSKQTDGQERNYQERSEQNGGQQRSYRERCEQNNRQEENDQDRSKQNEQEKSKERSKQNDGQERNLQENSKYGLLESDFQKRRQNNLQERNDQERSKHNDIQESNYTERSDQNIAQKRDYKEKHNQNFDCSRSAASNEYKGQERYGLGKMGKKSELFAVRGDKESLSSVINTVKAVSQVEESSSSSKKDAYLIHSDPVISFTQKWGIDQDNKSTDDDSHKNSTENCKIKSQGNVEYETDALLSKSKYFSYSRGESVRVTECFNSSVGNLDNKSKQKHTTDGYASKLVDYHTKEKPAKSVSDKNSTFSVRRLREREPVSYQESSESLVDYEQDTQSHRTTKEAESSEASRIANKKARYSQTGNVLTHKEKQGKDNSSSATPVIPVCLANLDDSIAPVKFLSPDPWALEFGNELYQVTPDELHGCKEKKRKKTMDKEKARLSATYEKDSQGRQTAGLDKRKKLASPKSQSVVNDAASDKKSEISWIVEYKARNKRKETVKKTYKRTHWSPHSPHLNVSFQPEFDLIETTRTFRRGEPAAFTSQHSIRSPDSPFVSSVESTPSLNCQSVEHSDVDEVSRKGKASVNITQTPRTSFCGSAVSQQSFLSQLSQRLVPEPTEDVDWEDTGRQSQCTEESSPSPGVMGVSPCEMAPDRRSSRASKRQQSKSDEESRKLKKRGLLSGPSSIVRPSKSTLKRTFKDDVISLSEDEEEGIPKIKQVCLHPRQLFPDRDVDLSDSKGENSRKERESYGLDKNCPNENATELEAAAATVTSEISEEETAALDDTQSQLQSEIDGNLATLVKGFGCDLQKHMKTREFQVQQLAFGTLKLSNKRMSQLWLQDRQQWEQVVGEFKEHIDKELSSLEQEVADINRVEKKTQALYLEQLKLLCDKREKLQTGVEVAKRCYENFRVKSRHTQRQTQEVQRELESQMKQNMDQLKNKLLLDLQHQQLKRMRESIHKHFF